jgi:hypothetical protein
MTKVLTQLINDIHEQNIHNIYTSIEMVKFSSLKITLENENTLLHYVFSSNNAEIVGVFIAKLEELLGEGKLSKKDLESLFRMTNIAGFTAVDKILQENAAEKVGVVLKAIGENADIMEAFLNAKNENGMTIYQVAENELDENELRDFKKALKSGTIYIDGWLDWGWGNTLKLNVLERKKPILNDSLAHYANSEGQECLKLIQDTTLNTFRQIKNSAIQSDLKDSGMKILCPLVG